jgi:hypothetical protein
MLCGAGGERRMARPGELRRHWRQAGAALCMAIGGREVPLVSAAPAGGVQHAVHSSIGWPQEGPRTRGPTDGAQARPRARRPHQVIAAGPADALQVDALCTVRYVTAREARRVGSPPECAVASARRLRALHARRPHERLRLRDASGRVDACRA